MIPLLVLAAEVVAMSQRGVIMDVGVPGGAVLEVVTETPGVVVADVPMVVTMFSRRVGVFGFLALAFGALSHGSHRGASFQVNGCLRDLDGVCQATSMRHRRGQGYQDQMEYPLSLGLYAFRAQRTLECPLIMTGATLTVLPLILVFLFTQRYFIRGVAMTGIKG
jgi:hypothetical protein